MSRAHASHAHDFRGSNPRVGFQVSPTAGVEALQLHQTGAQATAASTRSPFATEVSPSQALIAPAKPCDEVGHDVVVRVRQARVGAPSDERNGIVSEVPHESVVHRPVGWVVEGLFVTALKRSM